VESVARGRAIFRLDSQANTNSFTAWCTAKSGGVGGYHSGDRGFRGDSQGEGNSRQCCLSINYLRAGRAGASRRTPRVMRARGEILVVTKCDIFHRGMGLARQQGLLTSEPSPDILCTHREFTRPPDLAGFLDCLGSVLNHALKDEQVGTALACEMMQSRSIPLEPYREWTHHCQAQSAIAVWDCIA